jgi:CRISP-associated protein Cas1
MTRSGLARASQPLIADDLSWATRGLHWIRQSKPLRTARRTPIRRPRARPEPLIVTGHGAHLRIERGALIVQNGFTHYPQPRQEWRLFPGDWRLPSRIVLVDVRGSISVDVIRWLAQHNVTLIFLDWRGNVTVAIGGDGSAVDKELRARQLEVSETEIGLSIARTLVRQKILAGISTLQALGRKISASHAIQRMRERLASLDSAAEIRAILLVEASAAHSYFAPLKGIPVNWQGDGQARVPREWRRVGQRRSFLGWNRNATHPVQAMLNYAYAVLESQIRIAVSAVGLDPTIGYLHANEDSRPALVLDLMEPLRPMVDRLLMEFVAGERFSPSDFSISRTGLCRLHPQLARRVVQAVSRSPMLALGMAETDDGTTKRRWFPLSEGTAERPPVKDCYSSRVPSQDDPF